MFQKCYYSKIIKYRTGIHRLPVEAGRWDDIPLNERKCKRGSCMVWENNMGVCPRLDFKKYYVI